MADRHVWRSRIGAAAAAALLMANLTTAAGASSTGDKVAAGVAGAPSAGGRVMCSARLLPGGSAARVSRVKAPSGVCRIGWPPLVAPVTRPVILRPVPVASPPFGVAAAPTWPVPTWPVPA